MTTIATDGRSMAADTLITGGGYKCGIRRKVHKLPDGRVYGACGFCDDATMFSEWMTSGGDKPKLDKTFEALVLYPSGVVKYMSFLLIEQEYIAPMAIGTGGEIAIGAMLAGASPVQAVNLAMMRDTHTGGTINVEYAE